jgi:glyoxylase-like metal-dependent hydrolase (beta-lactamase superfamily II)
MQLPPPIVTLLQDFDAALTEANHDVAAAVTNMSKTPAIGSHRIEFAPGVECVPLPTATLPPATHTNCYILGEAGGQRIVVDPAAKSEAALAILEERILETIADGGEIIATIFTHRHSDHIGDLKRIAEIYQAPIWASQETLDEIPKCDSDRGLISGDELSLKGPDGEVIWQVVATPGHCPGHICLASKRGVVSADLVSVVGTILVPSTNGDMQQYMDDLETIRSLRPAMLFPGHGPYTTNPDAILQRYIRHRNSRHERVLDAVRTGCSEVTEIAERAYADTPDADIFLAADQTISHLKSHEAARLVQCFGDHWRPYVE